MALRYAINGHAVLIVEHQHLIGDGFLPRALIFVTRRRRIIHKLKAAWIHKKVGANEGTRLFVFQVKGRQFYRYVQRSERALHGGQHWIGSGGNVVGIGHPSKTLAEAHLQSGFANLNGQLMSLRFALLGFLERSIVRFEGD